MLLGQDTLVLSAPFTSQRFIIDENGRFTFRYRDCTGVSLGKGIVKKGIFKWKFVFDSAITPKKPFFVCDSASKYKKFQILFKSIQDSTEIQDFSLYINGRSSMLVLDDHGFDHSGDLAIADTIVVEYWNDTIRIVRDKLNCKKLTVYLYEFPVYKEKDKGTVKYRKSIFSKRKLTNRLVHKRSRNKKHILRLYFGFKRIH